MFDRTATRVVIIGGSVAGLASAIGLARTGFDVVIVERDAGPATNDGDVAFLEWDRRNVPQFRQPHGFSARSHTLLMKHAPDVVDRLAADGVTTSNIFKKLAPPELWDPADDAFDGLMTRRPAFELALRRTAEAQAGVTFVCPANATGLLVDPSTTGRPHVRGVRLEDGSVLEADVVLDCGGRRTLVPGWLAAAGADIPVESQDCDTTYYTRYFRLLPSSTMDPFFIFGINLEVVGALQVVGFPGEKQTFAVGLGTMAQDEDLAALRHNWAWEAVVGSLSGVAAWTDESNAVAVNDVAVMSGHRNIRRHFVADGKPAALGLLPVGDSLCTTNPAYGWGASMALTYAFAAVDAIGSHAGDLESMAVAYDAAISGEVDGVYRESAAMDRWRIYRWRGRDIPEDDRAEMDRQELIARGLNQGASRDPVLGRAFLRRSNLIDPPHAVFADPDVLAKAKESAARAAERASRRPAPTRDEVLAAIAAAAPRHARI